MKSMTGFGRSSNMIKGLQCTVEIKSVNSRFLDINVRSPKELNHIEHILRKLIKDTIHRGKVDVSIILERQIEDSNDFSVNSALKEQIQELLVKEGFYPSMAEVPLQAVLAISKDWIQYKEESIPEEEIDSLVMSSTKEALDKLIHMRRDEGGNIQQALLDMLSHMTTSIDYIDDHKIDILETYKVSLESKISDLLASKDVSISEDRILQEVAIMADKTDVTEEIVRFRSHVVQLGNTLIQDEPIGRKLDFIIQEMNREINTIGSKAMDLSITDRVVQLKCELEKVREQVQNIE